MNSLQESLFSDNAANNYLNFVNLPNQVHRKSAKKGFQFTLLVVGESGLGKSTLINSLFLTNLYKNREFPLVEENGLNKKVQMVEQNAEVEEKGVKLRLTIVDALNYGESVNSKDSIEPIIKYIDEQFDQYFQYENGLNRRNINDTRVHCCFYFISPIGYGLKPLDILFLKELSTKVNIIPLIAKADSLTTSEKEKLKKRILEELKQHQIQIYSIPDCEDDDPSYLRQINEIKESIPFAICSSTDKIDVNGKTSFGRQYVHGVCDILNPTHSDFLMLRSMLVAHLSDLRDVTNELLYENFRSARLASNNAFLNVTDDSGSISNSFKYDETEKDKMLREKELEIKRMQEVLQKMEREMKLKAESQS